MDERLPAQLEATAIMRRVQAEGGFAAILKRGDADRGSLALLVTERGTFRGLLERTMGEDFRYRWSLSRSGESLDSEKIRELIGDRAQFDPDFWLIELDVAEAERFIAETISAG